MYIWLWRLKLIGLFPPSIKTCSPSNFSLPLAAKPSGSGSPDVCRARGEQCTGCGASRPQLPEDSHALWLRRCGRAAAPLRLFPGGGVDPTPTKRKSEKKTLLCYLLMY